MKTVSCCKKKVLIFDSEGSNSNYLNDNYRLEKFVGVNSFSLIRKEVELKEPISLIFFVIRKLDDLFGLVETIKFKIKIIVLTDLNDQLVCEISRKFKLSIVNIGLHNMICDKCGRRIESVQNFVFQGKLSPE